MTSVDGRKKTQKT